MHTSARLVRTSAVFLSATLVGIAAELPMPPHTVAISNAFPQFMDIRFKGFLTVGDVNNDGREDIVTPKAIYQQAIDGTFAIDPTSLLDEYSSAVVMVIPDVTGDGVVDFLVQGDSGLRVELQAGDANTGRPSGIALASLVNTEAFNGSLYPKRPQVVDIDDDGDLDVAFISQAANQQGVHVFIKDSGTFAATPTTLLPYAGIARLGVRVDQGRKKLVVSRLDGGNYRADFVTLSGQTPAFSTLTPPSGIPIEHLSGGQFSSNNPDANLLIQFGPLASGTGRFVTESNALNADGAFWIVPDLTGDGLDDLVARPQGTSVPSGVVPTVAGFSPGANVIRRPFADATPVVDIAGSSPFFPYAVGSGVDVQGREGAHRLVVASASNTDVFIYPSIAPSVTLLGNTVTAGSVAFVFTDPNLPVQLFQTGAFDTTQVNINFGDSETIISSMKVMLTSPNAGTDSLTFTLGTIAAPTVTPTLGLQTYEFTTPASVAAYQSLVNSIRYVPGGSPVADSQASVSMSFNARDRATANGDGYALSPYGLATVTFTGTPVTTLQLAVTDPSGLAILPISQADANANTARFSLAIVQDGSQGFGTITQAGQELTYQANQGALGSDEIILSVTDEVDNGEGFDLLEIGRIRVQITLPSSLPLTFFFVSGSPTVDLGASVVINVGQGVAPYSIRANRSATLAAITVSQPQVSRASRLSNQAFYVKPHELGATVITITDADGSSVDVTLTTSLLPSVEVPRPSVPVSVGGQTIFGPICPGTPQGVTSLLNGLQGRDSSQARGFTWEASAQRYVELPAVPNDGIGPTTGVFLASRADLGLDFSGSQLPIGAEIILQREWNFVGLGPVQDGVETRTTHTLATDFVLSLLEDGSQVGKDQIGDTVYFWNGSGYEQTTTLQSNIGYWVKNLRVDGKQLSLKRVSNGTGFAARAARAESVALNEKSAPPAPPAAAEAQSADESGGCGFGSGIAALLGGLLLMLRMRFRR